MVNCVSQSPKCIVFVTVCKFGEGRLIRNVLLKMKRMVALLRFYICLTRESSHQSNFTICMSYTLGKMVSLMEADRRDREANEVVTMCNLPCWNESRLW